MRRYDALIDKLFSLNSGSKNRRDLTSIQKVAALLGNPQNQFPTVHIAGTNGKGSVAFKMAEALRLGGYRVGLYSSPHLFSYRERIQINGEMIEKADVISGLEKLFQICLKPHFFECSTLLALNYFFVKNVEIAIIEAGIGGRLDPTNIIAPILSVITTVDYDHQEILGKTRSAIAAEKGGIIKTNTPILLGSDADVPILKEMSRVKKAPLYLASSDNREIAWKALEVIHSHFPLDPQSKAAGVAKCLPCRFQVEKNIVFDVAHNPSAFTHLFAKVKELFPNQLISLLFAFSKEKNLGPIVELLKRHVDEVALLTSKHPRLRAPLDIANELEKRGYHRFEIFKSAAAALKALTERGDQRIIVVAGSFYMMEEVFHACSLEGFDILKHHVNFALRRVE